jgi:hypothetical protein
MFSGYPEPRHDRLEGHGMRMIGWLMGRSWYLEGLRDAVDVVPVDCISPLPTTGR